MKNLFMAFVFGVMLAGCYAGETTISYRHSGREVACETGDFRLGATDFCVMPPVVGYLFSLFCAFVFVWWFVSSVNLGLERLKNISDKIDIVAKRD